MKYPKTAVEYYERLRPILESNALKVNPYREIQYGIQFIVFDQSDSGIVRIFQSKKGLRLDLSQVKSSVLLNKIDKLSVSIEMEKGRLLSFAKGGIREENPSRLVEGKFDNLPIDDPDELIGIDESGKGDYFGPLVVAAVYVDQERSQILRKIGVMDSKKLSDERIAKLSAQIKQHCYHSLVEISNKSYNDLYLNIQNLNNILAWGHARVLENVLEQVDCRYALSDQFAQPNLIKSTLFSKGKMVKLFQRPKAESNIAVAAASILARDAFVKYIDEMATKFETVIPKGSGDSVAKVAQLLVNQYGKDILPFVVKLHFKLTQKLKMNSQDA